MNCSKCGFIMNESDSFCKMCGSKKDNNNLNITEELIDVYIGKNADKIKSGKFSWSAFFFNKLYCWYRKMWILWLIWAVATYIVDRYLPFAWIINLVGTIAIAANFNKLYMKKVKENVQKIIAENPGKSNDELKLIVAKKGGTTKGPIIFSIVSGVILVVVFVVSIALIVVGLNSQTTKVECNELGGIWENGVCKNY